MIHPRHSRQRALFKEESLMTQLPPDPARRPDPKQAGFTLVELAIVLVIIGLILGGVIGGQALLNNARVRNLDQAMKGYAGAIQNFVGTYSVLPGDDSGAATRFPGAPFTVSSATGGTAGDGALTGTAPFTVPAGTITTTNEQQLLWHHLRAAGLIDNANPNWGQPDGPFSPSFFGVQNNAFDMNTGMSLCLSGVPQAQASQYDQQFDDGAANGGNVRAFQVAGARPATNVDTQAPSADYATAGTYIVCRLMN